MSLSSCKQELNELSKVARRNLLRFLLFLVFVNTYVTLGAFLFFYIEECYDVIPVSLTEAEINLKAICFNITNKHANLNSSLLSYESEFCQSIYHLENPTCKMDLFAFSRWAMYTSSVASTIGYGNVVTRSDTGKIVTMIYAIPGIALTAGTYLPAARGLIAMTKYFLIVFEISFLKRKNIKLFPIKVFVIQTCLAILLMLWCSLLSTLKQLEGFSLLNSIYFSFISLTTIGFGDYYYKYERYIKQPWLFFPAMLSFFSGMGMFASVVSSLGDVLSSYSTNEKKKRKYTVTNEHATN
ncbi:potassium channel subfamily K member 2-like [Hydractinia symbiolongicarpus]|uniref:potassium channel subfamily K member 2-like n=1 Tax=Hydractinia symbiolongicarpus TaxID=13093 RepID=UPI002550268F|nr:potassium channel subfamily K member 2-like [Hydractinia symbiolongicarpus]XP_057313451.1 potassium channel subfamily K member 2-like [Hydractinia symbiolongicarpus]